MKWYRAWADKWVEQGGITGKVAIDTYNSYTISLLIPLVNTNYYANIMQWDNGEQQGLSNCTGGEAVHTKGTASFVIATFSWYYLRMWNAKGYKA